MGQFGVSSFVWLTKSHGEPRHVVGSQQKTTTKAAFLTPTAGSRDCLDFVLRYSEHRLLSLGDEEEKYVTPTARYAGPQLPQPQPHPSSPASPMNPIHSSRYSAAPDFAGLKLHGTSQMLVRQCSSLIEIVVG